MTPEKAQIAAAWLAPVFMWGGTLIYVAKGGLTINPVPWLVWTAAAVIAAFNTICVERGLSPQSTTFIGCAVLYLLVIFRHRKRIVGRGLPTWQKAALPLLMLSPVITLAASPTTGILLQVAFSGVTAWAFCQTVLGGLSRESAAGWGVEAAGCGFLSLSTIQHFPQNLYPLASFFLSVACLGCILIQRKLCRDEGADAPRQTQP